jgi:D-lactate dehydrogenase
LKIAVYSLREDEKEYLIDLENKLQLQIVRTGEEPSLENIDIIKGCQGVSVLGQTLIEKELLDAWKAEGVQYISTRTIGYNHIDITYAKKIGLRVCNANYAPNGVSDFTIMMILMCLRNYKQALWRGQVNDFSLWGLRGREMRNLTVGIMGTGRIGQTVLRALSGFGCRLIAYDVYQNDEAKRYAEYVSLDEFYQQADVISLHVPLMDSTFHIINADSIQKMKDKVIIVNCARGELVDLDSAIEGIESGKIGALGLDVVEGEEGITHVDHRIDIISNQKTAYLRQFRNVIMTPHMAFYTEEAVESMINCGIKGILEMSAQEKGSTEII